MLLLTPLQRELFKIAGVIVAAILMVIVVRWRRQSFRAHLDEAAEEEVCPHLKPVLDLLISRGHRIVDVGQKHEEYPLEIHLAPLFDPAELVKELQLQPPVFVSERNVLYCKEHWCELHPRA
ncbi:MAG TPA: hypothetical protein VGQ99_13840 [Tepidisphaeraceae bacterium]|nr:hypothetical protein [Tepidisphaeraceae bacterium]HEV8606450.1 hypothetical protein [Tepidisphaeraceae bacterium]